MFSKVITLLSFTLIAFSTVAHAETLPLLSMGSYDLTSGDEDYCFELQIAKKDLSETSLKLGKDRLSLSNQEFKEPSDTQTECEDQVVSTREDIGESTKLTRVVTAICKGQVKTTSEKSAIITKKTITWNQKLNGKSLGTCVYTKK